MHDEVSTNKKDLRDFLVDVQEELMDALLYIEASRACLQEEIEECYINDRYEPVNLFNDPDHEECEGILGSHPLCSTDYCPCKEEAIEKRMNIIGRNGNTGEHYTQTSTDTAHYIYNKISDYPG